MFDAWQLASLMFKKVVNDTQLQVYKKKIKLFKQDLLFQSF